MHVRHENWTGLMLLTPTVCQDLILIIRVLKLQTRATQVILDLDTSARSVDMFKQLNWIPYYNEVKIHT